MSEKRALTQPIIQDLLMFWQKISIELNTPEILFFNMTSENIADLPYESPTGKLSNSLMFTEWLRMTFNSWEKN